MAEKYQPKEGDRVRVVLEGEVTYAEGDDYFEVGALAFRLCSEHVVSVEKIEPRVGVFGPGDVVRSKTTGCVFTLAKGGYVGQNTGRFHLDDGSFTSEHYERVDLP